jgi:hypothetical protein
MFGFLEGVFFILVALAVYAVICFVVVGSAMFLRLAYLRRKK